MASDHLPKSHPYARRRAAVLEREKCQEEALYAAVLLDADPLNTVLQDAATEAGEALTRAHEKIEYLDAVIDAARAHRTRAADAPTPEEILVRQERDRQARSRAHYARRLEGTA
jgi:hypothetical protein